MNRRLRRRLCERRCRGVSETGVTRRHPERSEGSGGDKIITTKARGYTKESLDWDGFLLCDFVSFLAQASVLDHRGHRVSQRKVECRSLTISRKCGGGSLR